MAASAGCTAQTARAQAIAPLADATVLPLLSFGTQPAVHGRINGRGPYLFLVDTGASGVARVDSSVVQAINLPIVGQAAATGATGGAPTQVRRVAVKSLSVGSREYKDLTPLSRSYNTPGEYLPDLGGILALNLFANELLTIDFPKRQMRIERGELPSADGVTVLDYEERDGLIYLPITLAAVKLRALVDTGSDRNFDVPASVIRQMRLSNFPHPIGQAEGVTGRVGIAEVAIDGDLIVGGHRLRQPLVTFSDAFEFPILGSVFFRDFAMTIDQRNRRIRLLRQ